MKKAIRGILKTFKGIKLFFLKIRGLTPDDVSEKRVVTGKAWEEFCDTIKTAGASLMFGKSPRDPFNMAEGYRYLSRIVRIGLETFLEYYDPKVPILRRMVNETAKLGADNPDNYYWMFEYYPNTGLDTFQHLIHNKNLLNDL